MDIIYTVLLGILEGLTEFLPISSTGHLIVASALLGFPPVTPPGYRETFEIFIQLGAILAVVVYFSRDLLQQARELPTKRETQQFWVNIFIAFLPAAVFGLLLKDKINELQKYPIIVGITLVLGGIVFLWLERNPRPDSEAKVQDLSKVTTVQALIIGVSQLLAFFPGVSRSGASIVTGMLTGLSRSVATKFTFYLAIPTLVIATLYQLFSAIKKGEVGAAQLPILGIGTVVSFIVALLAIAWFLRFVATNNFRVFGVYRIVAGLIIIGLVLFTTVLAH